MKEREKERESESWSKQWPSYAWRTQARMAHASRLGQNWSLSSSTYLHYNITHGAVFQLRQGEVSLLCSVMSIPQLDILQEAVKTQQGQFVFQGNRESPV